MTPCDLLILAPWTVPVIPSYEVYRDYATVVDRGTIVDLLPRHQALERFAPRQQLDLTNHMVLPGLINAHGHAAMSLLRGYADDLPLTTWLNEHIWPAEGRHMSADFVYQGTQLAMAEMIRSGTTCFGDMYFYPDRSAAAIDQAGLRAQISFPILEFPSAWAHSASDYLDKGLALAEQYQQHSRISVNLGPHAPYTVSDNTFERIGQLASERAMGIHIHVHETQTEVQQSLHEHHCRPLQRLHRLGILGPQTQCVHMTALDQTDVDLLCVSGASVVHCPESNLKLASGYCPVAKLHHLGVRVALGTDGCASNNNLDMFGELHTAALLAKTVADDASALRAHDALAMATINGAKAMGLETVTGSLEVGKAADIIALQLDPIEHTPCYDPISALVYTHNGHRVTHSWVAGQALLMDRQLQTLDTAAIVANARQWQHRIAL